MDEQSLDGLPLRALLERGLANADSDALTPRQDHSPIVPSMASVVEAAMDQLLARLFPEYRFIGRLGRGGGGTVYRAEHRQLRRQVAIKILSNTLTRSVAAVARFEREIEAVGKLDDSRIVRAFDGGQREGIWFLAMELVEGPDFGALSRTVGPLPISDACELVRQAALALQHAHERKLIHRDVKPSNLMLMDGIHGTPLVKVLDFGLAQLMHDESAGGGLTLSGELLGTVDYVAPEQIVNPRMVDERVDIYGLGATLYRLLSGQAPHHASESTGSLYERLIKISHQQCPGIGTLRPDLPSELAGIVDKMVARDPFMRFATAAEVADALKPFAEAHSLRDLVARLPQWEVPKGQEHVSADGRLPSIKVGRRRVWASFALALVGFLAYLPWQSREVSQWLRTLRNWSPGRGVAGPSWSYLRGLTLGPDGAFYGGTLFGGDSHLGVLYRFIPPSTVVPVVHFSGTNGPFKGSLIGRELLLGRDGALYGVTERGGHDDQGTVFRFDPNQGPGAFTTLVEFNGTNGSEPQAGLTEDHERAGVFYGGTQHGGTRNSGVLFRLVYNDGTPHFETLAELTGDSGEAPGRRLVASLAQTADGTLFGTTPEGGSGNGGTAFRLTRDGKFTSLANFGLPPLNMRNPCGGLTVGHDGNLYGHCYYETGRNGAAFRLTPSTGQIQIIARFGRPHGLGPVSTMSCGFDGAFYGTTLFGGAANQGTVFRLTPDGQITTLASFTAKGGHPADTGVAPVLAADGAFYGATERGGKGDQGAIYRLSPDGRLTTVLEFAQPLSDR